MREAIDQFLDDLVYERGLSPKTRDAYGYDLAALLEFLAGRKIASWQAVTREDLDAFLVEGRAEGYASATSARRFAAIRVFWQWLAEEEIVKSDITEVMPLPRHERVLPRTLSEADMAKLLDSISGDSRYEIRDRAMLELLYATGLRVSELVSLKVGDLDIGESLVRCIGKGNKQRVVPVGREACEKVSRYLAQARPVFQRRNAISPILFLTHSGTGFTREGVLVMLKARARAAGITATVSPHVLRHCFASHLLAHGADIRAIQEMLGHADISTTQIYTHIDPGTIVETHRKFFPRD